MVVQGELTETVVGSRYPVNCISVNNDHLIAIGDCGGNLRVYQKRENSHLDTVTTIDIAGLFAQELQSDTDPGMIHGKTILRKRKILLPGCDILSVRLEDTELSEGVCNEDDLPSLLTSKMTVTEDITRTRQTCLVGTTLGLCVLDLRSRSVREMVRFSQLVTASPSSSLLSSLASRLVLSR